MLNDTTIRTMIDIATADGTRQIVLTGEYTIYETVLIPSDFTIVLDNCRLTMAPGTFCNLFRNRHADDPYARTVTDADRNIRIIGRGKAILDGGEYNGLCEGNSEKDGSPHISVNNLLLFVNVDGFVIQGIQCRNQRWWALNFLFCAHGVLENIDFCADDTRLLPDGTRVHGLRRDSYGEVYIKNADGIDLRSGCHDIRIENITGFTEDDTIALTGLWGKTEQMYQVEGADTSIHNVIIRNVQSAAYCTNVRLLNQSGIRLYNILIDGVMDTSAGSPHMDRGIYAVRIGDNHLYGTRHSTPEETKNITVRNIYGRGSTVVQLAGSITNLVLDNICTFGECSTAVDNQARLYRSDGTEIH